MRTGIGRAHDEVSTKSTEAQAFYDQGLAYLHSYVWIEAVRSFHQALRSDPSLAMAQVGLSYAYVEVNKPTEARQTIESAFALSATAAKRGIAESPDPADRGQGSVMASIPYFERALKISPNHFGAQHYLAHAYENGGRISESLAARREFDLGLKAWAAADQNLPELAVARKR